MFCEIQVLDAGGVPESIVMIDQRGMILLSVLGLKLGL